MKGTRARLSLVGALFLAIGAGVAYATIPDSNGAIHACYKNANGALRVIDAGACNGSESPIDLGGPTEGYVGMHTGSVTLFETSLPVARVELKPGKYLLHAKANLANLSFGSSDGAYVPCDLRVEGTTTMIDNNPIMLEGPLTSSEAYVEGVSLQAPLTLSSTAFVDLECAFIPRGPGATHVEARNAQIDAISVDGLTIQGS